MECNHICTNQKKCDNCSVEGKMKEYIPSTSTMQNEGLITHDSDPSITSWVCQIVPRDENKELSKETFLHIIQYHHVHVCNYDSWLYTKKLQKSVKHFGDYVRYPIETNEIMRKGMTNKQSTMICDIFKNAPRIKSNIVCYRGLSCRLDLKAGDIFSDKAPMFCTLEKRGAKYFTNDTSMCYGQTEKIVKKSKEPGMVFELKIKNDTQILDLSNYSFLFPSPLITEIVIPPNAKFRVSYIEKNFVQLELIDNE